MGGCVQVYANTVPFYIRNFNAHGFWYLQGSWKQSPMDTEVKTVSEKELLSKMHKELLKLRKKKTNNLVNKMRKDLNRHLN